MAFDMFVKPTYEYTEKPSLLDAYTDQMVTFLQTQYPETSPDDLRVFIQDQIQKKQTTPRSKVITHPEYGRNDVKTYDLMSYLDNARHHIYTPSGSAYIKATEKESVIKTVLEQKTKERKYYKNKMLEADATGSSDTFYYSNIQSSAKVFNNSIFGSSGNQHSILYDKAMFNGITSTARYCAMVGYGHTEKFLGGNLYLRSIDEVMNYCTAHIRVCPNDVDQVIATYGLTVPTANDVAMFFYNSLRYYTDADHLWTSLVSYIQTLSVTHRTFVFYAHNLYNLIQSNDAFFRTFLAAFFDRTVPVDMTFDPAKIFKVEEDLLTLVVSINSPCIEGMDLNTAITQCPDGVRKLGAICRHMESCLENIGSLIRTFLCVDIDIPNVMQHPDMVRRTVTVSDTDSAILSTQRYIEWYIGKVTFDQDAYDINAFITFMTSQSLEHVFARVSAGMGMLEADVYRIKMKNEFLYPIMLRTPNKKHYAGIITIKEGKVLPKPKDDIKGGNLRGSAISKTTTDAVITYIKDIINTVTTDQDLYAADCLQKVVDHEQYVYRSLSKGELTFFPTVAVKNKQEYKNGDETQAYFYYLLWQEVFAPVFGHFILPNKGYGVPILGKGYAVYDKAWHDELETYSPGLGQRMETFLRNNDHKRITQIIVPPIVHEIPQIFLKVMDIRKIVYTNGNPFYLVLNSLGISPNYRDTTQPWLISDHHYGGDAAYDIRV